MSFFDSAALLKKLIKGKQVVYRSDIQFHRLDFQWYEDNRLRQEAPIFNMPTAFCRASGKDRPMAITSPTLFISVPMVRSAVLSLCVSQRGIFTTI